MDANEGLLTETIAQTIAIYSVTRRRTPDEKATALRELRCYLPVLINQGVTDRTRLTVKALTHLRELEHRPLPVPNWMRHRTDATAPSAPVTE